MAGVRGASVSLCGGGDTGHTAAAAGFSARERDSLWKTASTAHTAKTQEPCISSSATIQSIPQQQRRQWAGHHLPSLH